MIPLKYRAFNHRIHRYIRCRTIVCDLDGAPVFISSGGLDAKRIPIKDVTLERWTGHYDRAGQEIFEGDLLQKYNHLYGTYYLVAGAITVVEWKETATYSGFGITERGAHLYAVVGNRHQDAVMLEAVTAGVSV